MLYMTYRIYLRWPNSQTTEKTATEDPFVAALAYCRLVSRPELVGQPVAVACTRDNKQVEYFDFASRGTEPNGSPIDYLAQRCRAAPSSDPDFFHAMGFVVATQGALNPPPCS